MSNSARISAGRLFRDGTDPLVRRIAIFCLCAWAGMSVLVQILTLSSFSTLDNITAKPPASYTDAARLAGEPLIHELLHYQAAADMSAMLGLWGWIQLGMAASLFALLLFFSSAGRVRMGFSLALLIDALLIAFALIPTNDDLDRRLALAPASQSLAIVAQHARLASLAFVISQSVALVLCLSLLGLFLRRSRASHGDALR